MLPAPLSFHDTPNAATLTAARTALADALDNASKLTDRIVSAEERLAQIVKEARNAIEDMQREKDGLEETIVQTRAYLSPIRRMPGELLRELFLWCFEDHPCCAWVLSAVCSTWRRQALAIPRIWSKIRLFTNQRSSPDTIRLWLERSGANVPLDIEIYLRVVTPGALSPDAVAGSPYTSRRRFSPHHPLHHFAHPPAPTPLPPLFGTGPLSLSLGLGAGGASHAVLVPHFTPSVTPFIVPQPHHGGWESPPPLTVYHQLGHGHAQGLGGQEGGGTAAHWGHIAVYYLVQQMHRWERFVFRFDKAFGSIGALKSIIGPAPLLREFEVSCASAVAYPQDWNWLPTSPSLSLPSSVPSQRDIPLPKLNSLTLQYAPFTPTSPIFLQPQTHLSSLTLRALPGASVPLDRILGVVTANASTLKVLRLHFSQVANAVLPVPALPSLPPPQVGLIPVPPAGAAGANPNADGALELPALEELYIGGHHLLSQLLDAIATPQLESLDLDFDAPREPLEECIAALCARSGGAPLKMLSIAYGPPNPSPANSAGSTPSSPAHASPGHGGGSVYSSYLGYVHGYGYGGPGNVMSWAFLGECGDQLEVLKVGGAVLESLVSVLCSPEDGGGVSLPPGANLNAGVSTGNGGLNGWMCPKLRELRLRGCHGTSHGHHAHDAVAKLVRMVDARNPESPYPIPAASSSSSGSFPSAALFPSSTPSSSSFASSSSQTGPGGVKRLAHLELDDCVPLGPDVRAWLESRLGKGGVLCVEPAPPPGSVDRYGYGGFAGPVWM
ncbi:hypothetical protein B0H16DRAFT_113382 [Mycena metata]|uniref:F-box domain-containing protein n=1 Tax=Mycena metata TaxID=1033252 RepID=A0AAD7NSZ3_9AGAR|nr:hypothetical protein B0H16DRAFT_113382 [Mycena metata]